MKTTQEKEELINKIYEYARQYIPEAYAGSPVQVSLNENIWKLGLRAYLNGQKVPYVFKECALRDPEGLVEHIKTNDGEFDEAK